MCGIAGKVDFKLPIVLEDFNRLRDTLAHRGPDGFSSVLLKNGEVALGHRRLSIIDLTDNGQQPMCNEDQKIWITFNGEIYNFQTLRSELKQHGHVFKSASDTEVLIHGYEQWGIEGLLKKAKGMFAFAIWDGHKDKLFLARDRFGIKPLYYYQVADKFIFASEIKAILADKTIHFSLDMSSVYDFFVYRFIPSPKSIWKEIKKLSPASYLTYDYASQHCAVRKYWSVPVAHEIYEPRAFQKKFASLLQKSVDEHLISDVPVGLFLSGGYDSSTLAYLTGKSGNRFHSFSIGFKDWVESEHESARIAAMQINTFHHEKIIDSSSLNLVSDLSYYYDEPLGGSSFLPTYLVSKFTQENNIKVVVAGDGGDELLGGYKWHTKIYSEIRQRKWWQKITEKDSDFLLRRYFEEMSWAGFNYRTINKVFDGALSEKDLPDDLWFYRDLVQPNAGALKNLQLLDFKGFMPEVVLNKVDRASMANSIEVRVPFLDHELVEFVMQSEVSNYYTAGVFKKPLLTIMKEVFPDTILNKPKKGFGAPVHFFNEAARLSPQKPVERNGKNRRHSLNGTTEKRKAWAASIYDNWFDRWNSNNF